jgi:hypothetical protein
VTTLRRYFKTSPARLPPTAAGFFVRVTYTDIDPAAERTRLYIGDWWRTWGASVRRGSAGVSNPDYRPAARLPHARPPAGFEHRLAPPRSPRRGF